MLFETAATFQDLLNKMAIGAQIFNSLVFGTVVILWVYHNEHNILDTEAIEL